jgi:hypothetical protein
VDEDPGKGDGAIDDAEGWIERRRGERREIDLHRAELVEALDRAEARSWRRDVVFAAIGTLVGAVVTIAVAAATR